MIHENPQNRVVTEPPSILSEGVQYPGPELVGLSLFTGLGGLDIAAGLEGINVKVANDIWEVAETNYPLNFTGKFLCKDILQTCGDEFLELLGRKRGELDNVSGGSSCVGLSGLNRHRDSLYPTNILMFKALDLISEIQPKTFCLEQVPGLGDLPVFNAFEEFKLRLKVDLSEYHVEARAVKALYLNTPQDRTRWVFIGTRKDTGLLPVFPKPIQGSLSHLTIGAIAPEIDYVETKSGKKIMRRENTEFFPTIPATESLTLILIDGTRMRLSEWVELMMKIFGIPEDFHFHPDLSFAEIHRLIGNSVPVPLGRAIFREIVRSLRSL